MILVFSAKKKCCTISGSVSQSSLIISNLPLKKKSKVSIEALSLLLSRINSSYLLSKLWSRESSRLTMLEIKWDSLDSSFSPTLPNFNLTPSKKKEMFLIQLNKLSHFSRLKIYTQMYLGFCLLPTTRKKYRPLLNFWTFCLAMMHLTLVKLWSKPLTFWVLLILS